MNQDTSGMWMYTALSSPVSDIKEMEGNKEWTDFAWVAFIFQGRHSLQALSGRTEPYYLLLCDLRIQLHSIHQKWVSCNQSSAFLNMEMGCELSWELTSWWQVREDKIWNSFCKTLSSSLATELGSVTRERTSGLSSHPEERLLRLRICWNWEKP